MDLTPGGMATPVSWLFANALFPMVSMFWGMLIISFNRLFANASLPMEVTLSGMFILTSLLEEKALSPIDSTLGGMSTPVS